MPTSGVDLRLARRLVLETKSEGERSISGERSQRRWRLPEATSALGPAQVWSPEEGGCQEFIVRLSDFQPGRGEVTISALSEEGEVTTGTFEFGVNTLYSGAFSFGSIRSQLKNPTFGLVAKGADSVITIAEDPKPRVLYTLTYTPFLWGKRDIEKERAFIDIRRFNPMFGIVLNDVQNNFVVGASYDLMSAMYFTAGAHFGRVSRLNPDGGVVIGKPFAGTTQEIPVVREWRGDFFLGLSLDLRAAAQFFGKAIGGAGGGT